MFVNSEGCVYEEVRVNTGDGVVEQMIMAMADGAVILVDVSP